MDVLGGDDWGSVTGASVGVVGGEAVGGPVVGVVDPDVAGAGDGGSGAAVGVVVVVAGDAEEPLGGGAGVGNARTGSRGSTPTPPLRASARVDPGCACRAAEDIGTGDVRDQIPTSATIAR